MTPRHRPKVPLRLATPALAISVIAASLALPSAAPGRPAATADRPMVVAGGESAAARYAAAAPAEPAPRAEPVSEVRRGRRSVAVPGGGRSILLANGFRFDPILDGEPPLRAPLAASEPDPDGVAAFLVQLRGAAGDVEREAIESAGALVVGYVPENAYLVRATSRSRAAVASLPFVRWVGRHHPAYKRSALLARTPATGPADLVVLLYPDADLSAARREIAAAGAEIVEATDSGRSKLLRVRTDAELADVLAAREDVAWVEPRYELRLRNDVAQWTVQTNADGDRRVWDMGLQGQGQIVHTSDSGIRTTHDQFRDDLVPITTWGDYPTHRKIVAYQPTVIGQVLFGDHSAASYHGTHTAGTLMGDDSPFAADPRDGMALKARIWFHDGGADANTIASPTDLNLLFGAAYAGNAAGGARISSNSWSAATMGEYTVLDMTADQFLHDHHDMLICFSTGNDGAPATVGSPATCKNAIGSGATQNGSLSGLMMPLTSQGPTQDGRTKPTIVSPGMSIVSANGANDTGYQSLTGTSMSSPSKAGATTLIRQYFTDGWYPTGGPVPGNAFTPSGALL